MTKKQMAHQIVQELFRKTYDEIAQSIVRHPHSDIARRYRAIQRKKRWEVVELHDMAISSFLSRQDSAL